MSVRYSEPVVPYPRPAAVASDALVDWVIAERGESPRHRIGDFLETLWRERPPGSVRTVLEVCCGTGLMLGELVRRGYRVTGVDRSPAVLEVARRRLGPQAVLVQAELPDLPLPAGAEYDSVISAAAGLNYLPDETALGETLHAVARVLRPGGTFVFDLLSRTLLERSFDPAEPRTRAVELEDVSYIWTLAAPPSKAYFDLTYVQFLRADAAPVDTYIRSRELHRMYPLAHGTLQRLAAQAGFTSIKVHDNYSNRPAGPGTLYETWTLATPPGARRTGGTA